MRAHQIIFTFMNNNVVMSFFRIQKIDQKKKLIKLMKEGCIIS